MKLTLSRVTQLAEKIKKNLNKITSDILIQSENKKFGRLVFNNLPEIVSIKEEENEMFIKQGNFFLYNWIQMKIIITKDVLIAQTAILITFRKIQIVITTHQQIFPLQII